MEKCKYQYEEADKYVVVNDNDPDLRPIVLRLPEPPPLHTIDGYGLPPEEQRFKRLAIPRRLIDLEAEAILRTKEDIKSNKNNKLTLIKIQKTFWNLVQERYKQLSKEIDFIRRVWYHRINGYWVFIKGKPYYLTGRFFYYLNFCYMDVQGERPEYRDCDRREYIFKEYCWTASETFEKLDEFGFAVPEEDGSYKMIDLGRRICFGDGQTKNRRRGNTSKGVSDGVEVVTRTIGTDGMGLQSYTEESAKGHFKGKVLPLFDHLPIWLKPYTASNRMTLKFETEKSDFGDFGLDTRIEYATTSSSKFFDGRKMMYLIIDESGKTSNVSVSERYNVNKHTLAQGDGMIIRGYATNPSTVDQLTDGSGDYQFLMESSNFYKRIKSKGQTPSGLFRVFIPAQDGLEGFVDSYGFSVTGNVKEYQKKEGFDQTAESYLIGERELLLKENTPESLKKHREHKQLWPMQYSDSWMGISGDIGLDIEKIDSQIAELRRKNEIIRGNFEWADQFGRKVLFKQDDIKGRFFMSKDSPDYVRNKMVRVSFFNPFKQKMEESWKPMYPGMFTVGVDPFRLGGKADRKISDSLGKKSSLSDGGMAILWNYDASIDGEKNKSEWESYRFVLTYRYRHNNTDDFNEDVLKAAIYFGGMVYPETNVPNTYEYFVKHGFGGYLLYDVDKYTGRLKDKPGVDSLERSKQEIFSLWRDYVDYRCHKEQHADLLHELKDIQGMEYMRHFDLVAAGGVALLGAKSPYVETLKRVEDRDYDLQDFLWT
jgi:hypothetical protein